MKEFIFKSISVFNHIKESTKSSNASFWDVGNAAIIASVLFDFLNCMYLVLLKNN